MPSSDSESFVEIGKIVRPHGVQGELRVQLFNADSEVLFEVENVRATFAEGVQREMPIEAARAAAAGVVLIRLAGVSDRTAAEGMRGVVLSVPRSSLPAPEEGEFYVADILGAVVHLVDGTELGKVVDYHAYPTTEVIVVQGASKRYEVPLVEDFVASVDAQAKRVVLHSVEGLEAE